MLRSHTPNLRPWKEEGEDRHDSDKDRQDRDDRTTHPHGQVRCRVRLMSEGE